MLGWLLERAARWPRATLAALAVLSVVGGLILVLAPVDGRLDRLAPGGSDAARAGELERQSFGGDTTLVVIRGDMLKTLRDDGDITRLTGLEGCLMGAVGREVTQGPCARMRDLNAVRLVVGPGTFAQSALVSIQTQASEQFASAVGSVDAIRKQAEAEAKKRGFSDAKVKEAGEAASKVVQLQALGELAAFAESTGLGEKLTDAKLTDDPFITSLFFAQGKDGKFGPKRRMAFILPNRETALIQIRLVDGLSVAKRAEVTEAIREVLSESAFELTGSEATMELTGIAPATQTLSESIRRSAVSLAIGAALVMAVVLLLARRLRRRLLPLLVAGAVVGAAMLGLLLGAGSLSLATVVALPILVGLAVDQAVQAQLRLERRLHPKALRSLVIAGSAAAASALALAASPFGVVRTVAIVLAAAILLAIVFAAIASAAALQREDRTPPPALADADRLIAESAPTRATLSASRSITTRVSKITRPAAIAVLVGGVAFALAGVAASSRVTVQTDLAQLVPPSSAGAQQLQRLQDQTGTASTISMVVKAKNVGDPEIWRYLVAAQRTVTAGTNGRCEVTKALCTPLSLDELFGSSPNGKLPTDAQIEGTLSVLPPVLQQSFIDADKGVIAIPFGIGTLDGERQRELTGQLQRFAAGAPGGSEIAIAGLPAVVDASADALESPGNRALLAALAVLLPALLLFAFLRSPRRVIVAVIPAALALGWSELAMWALGVPRTPLTAALGVLVCAVAIEFSVLLSERYAALRSVGVDQSKAIAATLRETGGAVVISAGATIAGFAVLGLASIPVIAEFGIATAVDLALVLLALVVVAPAAWVLADNFPPAQRPDAESRPSRVAEAASAR